MTGETDLTRLLTGMRPALDPVTYVFCRTGDPAHPARARALMQMVEDEGLTLILPAPADDPDLAPTFPCRRITLQIHSSLSAVGLMAAVATALARAGIGCNPVAGYTHDHLFVPETEADRAMKVLQDLAALGAT
jgi:uncharacterized protein